jgi:hypothetical protein
MPCAAHPSAIFRGLPEKSAHSAQWAINQNCVRRPPPTVVPVAILLARSDSTAA